MASQIYNRFDPAKGYANHRFVPGRPMQSAELNEIQSKAAWALRGIADTILSDGNVIRDANIVVDSATGVTQCHAGAVYLAGEVRGVKPAILTLSTVGTVAVGLRLVETIVTALEDPDLLDPAVDTRAYNKEGAERTQVVAEWGWSGDGLGGDFFPIYTVTDGVLNAKSPPPQLDAITQAIARYDRDSTGSSYIVRGLDVLRLADTPDGRQVYSVAAGRAYVNGFAVETATSLRLVRDALPVTRFISNEPTLSTTASAQRINVAHAPIANIASVSITAEKTVTMNRGTVAGTADPLPDDSILELRLVKQGGTTYSQPADYRLTAGAVDWSPTGAEPAPGSSYDVTYRYITPVAPTAVDETGFTVAGAVVGTIVQVSYNYKMPRVDRLCVNQSGEFLWQEGASSDFNPVRPAVPSNLLALCQVLQFWNAQTRVVNDGLRVLSMSALEGINERVDTVVQLVAQQKLASDAAQRDAASKKGMFTDPFLSDDLRDAGVEQDAAIVQGLLLLPIDATPHTPTLDPAAAQTCGYESKLVLEQGLRTSSMQINPYLSFGVLPAECELSPAIDRWTETVTNWTSPVTETFGPQASYQSGGWGSATAVVEVTSTQLVRSTSSASLLECLRPIDIEFTLRGFGAGEVLDAVTFDGISVAPAAV